MANTEHDGTVDPGGSDIYKRVERVEDHILSVRSEFAEVKAAALQVFEDGRVTASDGPAIVRFFDGVATIAAKVGVILATGVYFVAHIAEVL